MAETSWQARGVVRGVADGAALVSQTALSFLGDLDIRSGRVVGRSSDLCGECVAGRVLVMLASRGSAGAWRFLYQLKMHDTHPAALILREMPDPGRRAGGGGAGRHILEQAARRRHPARRWQQRQN